MSQVNQIVNIAQNIAAVRARIEAACQRAGRAPDDVILIAVSKKKPADSILQALEAGHQDFGENRLEEAQTKIPEIRRSGAKTQRWHMIGHVQSRKAHAVIAMNFDLIHSLDTIKLAARYNRAAVESNVVQAVLLEVNVSGEQAKSGWAAHDWEAQPEQRAALWQAVKEIAALPNLRIDGLMTMAPIVEDAEQTRPVFSRLADLRTALQADFPELSLPHLSMGMTDDFEVAIEEGASLVRVGRAIFGERLSG